LDWNILYMMKRMQRSAKPTGIDRDRASQRGKNIEPTGNPIMKDKIPSMARFFFDTFGLSLGLSCIPHSGQYL